MSARVVLAGTAVLFDFPTQRLSPPATAGIGPAAPAAGTVLIVLAAAWSSSSFFIAGSIVAGVALGMAFLGGFGGLVTVIPANSRGSAMAASYIVAYFSLWVRAVLAGVVVPHLGLRATF
jgi:hypothetical protein